MPIKWSQRALCPYSHLLVVRLMLRTVWVVRAGMKISSAPRLPVLRDLRPIVFDAHPSAATILRYSASG